MKYFDWDSDIAQVDYWPRTATLDWCEENYVTCKYIAEFWNSLTNISFVLLSWYGIRSALKQNAEKRFLLAYAVMGLIGLGSFLFHATLTYEMQLLDELPMIYCVCVLTYSIFQFDVKSSQQDYLLRVFLLVDSAFVTISYLSNKNPTFHQWAFGIHCAAILFRGSSHYRHLSPSPAKRALRKTLLYGWGMQTAGFVCWNIDNMMCRYLRGWRQGLKEPWAALLQFHAWWHLLTGLGTYAYILADQYLRIVMLGLHDEFVLKWKWGVLPVIVKWEEELVEAERRKKLI